VKRIVGFVLVFILALGLVPVQAREFAEMPELPSSFTFSFSSRVGFEPHGEASGEIAALAEVFGGDGFASHVQGVFVSEGLVSSLFLEFNVDVRRLLSVLPVEQIMPMVTLLGLDVNEPVRMWVESDFHNLNEPVFVIALEVPTFLRLPFMILSAEFANPFWVFNLSSVITQLASLYEAEIRTISEAQRAEMFEYLQEALSEWFGMFEDFQEEMEMWLAEAIDDFQGAVIVHTFERSLTQIENAAHAVLNFVATINGADYSADVLFEFDGQVAGNAERVFLPVTPGNSFDIMTWFLEQI
jgi:hypothetical protein